MTTTVTVRTRALGATVSVNGEETKVPARSEHSFHIEEGSQSFEVRQNTHEEQQEADVAENLDPENVPGREQNDALLNQDQASTGTEQPISGSGKSRARQPGDNRTGADETAQTTER